MARSRSEFSFSISRDSLELSRPFSAIYKESESRLTI